MPRRAVRPTISGVTTSGADFEVVIVGGGVAGLETLIALRSLAGSRVSITLVEPHAEFAYRPLTVTLDPVPTYSLDRIASDFRATHLRDRLSWVGAGGQRIFLES